MNLATSFKTLGLDPETDQAQAKRAYKAQVRRWHPDQFPEGSATKARAEEQLKQINIAYACVKAHLSAHRPDPIVSPPHPHQSSTDRYDPPGKKSKKRSWVDHLFDTLNACAGSRPGEPSAPPDDETDSNRPKTFEQVLDEMAGGGISPKPKRQPGGSTADRHRSAASHRLYARQGVTVDRVASSESPGPVKPVGRVRGIGRSR